MNFRVSLRKNKYNRETDVKVMVLSTLAIAVFSTGFYSVLLALSSLDFRLTSTENAPTSIPWIDNQAECDHSGRTWSDNKCWDYEHNPSF